jgi:glycosyltransferase involved in cell wall biosynthesis
MISLDSALAANPHGDARLRHREYAARAGRLTIVVYTPRIAPPPSTREAGSELTILPTNSRSRATFALDALRLAMQASKEAQPDLITTQDPFISGLVGWWLRGRLRAPLLVQNHSYFIDNPAWIAESPVRNRAFNGLGKFIICRADTYRTCNQQERETYLKLGGALERVFTFPLGTASEAFAVPVPPERLQALRERLGLQAHHKVVLWVGTPHKVKRVPLLLRVFQRVAQAEPDARLLLIGDMSRSADDLPTFIKQMGLRELVILPGVVQHDDLPAYYQLVQVCALTSIYEGLPRVLGEAGAAGLPVVAFDVVGVRDIVRSGETGTLVPDMDIEGMAQRILSLLNDPDLARHLGMKARGVALREYNVASNVEAVIAAWQKTIELGMH